MALNINTTIELIGGVTVPSAYGVIEYKPNHKPGDNYTLDLWLRLYKDKASFDAGEGELQIKPSEIPTQVRFLRSYGITQANYSNLDNGNIHTQLINLLQDGDADGNWNPDWGSWAGLGAATVTTVDLV